LLTDSLVYFFKLRAKNSCGETLTTWTDNSILLKANGAKGDTITLKWNSFQHWAQGVNRYEIFRWTDQQTTYSFYASVKASDTSFVTTSGGEAFHHAFYIKAYANDSEEVSYSNKTEIHFEHSLFIPNVITPNGDGRNDTFVIPYIKLYPDNEFRVWNRYGELVYSKRNYKDEWNGGDLSSGIYYFQLTVFSKGESYRGWVEKMD
jgi:gliding motility-associated-like protein